MSAGWNAEKNICFRNSWISLSKGLGEMQTWVTLEMYEVFKIKAKETLHNHCTLVSEVVFQLG